MRDLVIGVDVGTGSARAGVLDRSGRLLGRAEHPIDLNQPETNHAEHDSEQVWSAVCAAVRGALTAAKAEGDRVAGISFDATCSLVVRDREGAPLSVSRGGDDRWDTIV
jgi:ribulose kinase